MSELTPFGLVLRKLRLDKNQRLLDLSQALEISSSFLSAIETGRKPIPGGFVTKLSRAMGLSAEQVAELRKAKDRTRKEVDVDNKSEEQRELIAAFARRLDDVPDALREEIKKIVLKSMEAEHPFERKRRGILVPPVSTQVIRGYAEKVRAAFVADAQIEFPIVPVLEWGMSKVDPHFVFDVQDVDEMGDDEGRVPMGDNKLILRIDVYEGACRGVARDRFTACHELGHYLMHRRIQLARARSDTDKIYCDSEWQADTFAGTLLVSPRHAPHFRDADDMADACMVSPRAARVIWQKYIDEGVIKPATGPAFQF